MMEIINGNIIGGGPSSAEQLPANNNKTTQQELDELKQQNIALLEEVNTLKTSLNDLDFELVYNYSALKIYKNKNQVKLVSTGWHNTGSVILPADVRPKNNVYVACIGTGTDWSNKSSGFLTISSSGNLIYTAYNTGLYNTEINPANVIGFNASYFI